MCPERRLPSQRPAVLPVRTDPHGTSGQPHDSGYLAEDNLPHRAGHVVRYLAPITSWSFAVSTYCWNLVTLPSLRSQTWQTCASMLLPVALYVPV